MRGILRLSAAQVQSARRAQIVAWSDRPARVSRAVERRRELAILVDDGSGCLGTGHALYAARLRRAPSLRTRILGVSGLTAFGDGKR